MMLFGSTRGASPYFGARRSTQCGNTILEASFIILPMFALFFGMIDFGFLFFLQNTFQHATREGARFAITYGSSYNGTNCSTSQFTCIANVVQDNAFGFLGGSKSSYIIVNYYTANDLTNPVMTCQSGACTLKGALPQTLSNGNIVNYANQPGNAIEVLVSQYPWNWLVPIKGFTPGSGINLTSSGIDVLEGLPAGTITPPTP
jgi:Flp pilus assembly protein TadG